jgi:hypothetical protein
MQTAESVLLPNPKRGDGQGSTGNSGAATQNKHHAQLFSKVSNGDFRRLDLDVLGDADEFIRPVL